MATGSPAVKRQLIDTIGFLNWALIPANDFVEHFGSFTQMSDLVEDVAISPDTNDLHIVWKLKGDSDLYHEMVDYYNYESIEELLEKEVADDSWEVISGKSMEQVLEDDLGKVKPMRLSELLA